MTEDKEFSTITLRNLDSANSKDVAAIMNKTMQSEGLKTGQSVIEFIIRGFKKRGDRIDEQNQQIRVLQKELSMLKESSSETIEDLETGYKNFQGFIKVLNSFASSNHKVEPSNLKKTFSDRDK